MTLSELLGALNGRSIRLVRDQTDLIVDGDSLDRELLTDIRAHKAALLDLVNRSGGTWLSSAYVLTPQMLPWVRLTDAQLDGIARTVPGGMNNLQDVYPLAPLQEGILFHHLASRGDPYIQQFLFAFDSRTRLQSYLHALQCVIDRHDILRSAIVWEGLEMPVQVVYRKAHLVVEEIAIEAGCENAVQRLQAQCAPLRRPIDITQAPLIRVVTAYDEQNARWLMLRVEHQLVVEHASQERMQQEVQAFLLGRSEQLSPPVPFRHFIAQTMHGASREQHQQFFSEMLGTVREPTLAFGLMDVLGDGSGVVESRCDVNPGVARQLRDCARQLGVSTASLFHLAWAKILQRVTGLDDVVFGTVMFGRMQGSRHADTALGVFINTLPIRIGLGAGNAEENVRRTHLLLAQLLRHEQASLALANRCSGVTASTLLFNSLLNYRYSTPSVHSLMTPEAIEAWEGTEFLSFTEWTSYPLILNVDDFGEGYGLHVQVDASQDAQRIVEMMHTALERLVHTLRQRPWQALRKLDVLPERQREQLLVQFNASARAYERNVCLHELFERQATRTPQALALIDERESLSYAALDARANVLAVQLRTLGVGAERRVALCMERSTELVVALLAVLKAGGAYVPLDPAYPPERLSWMLNDSAPVVLLMHEAVPAALAAQLAESCTRAGIVRLSVTAGIGSREGQVSAPTRPAVPADLAERSDECNACSASLPTACAQQLAYVIYTSGSTGQPKGVMNTHAAVVNRLQWMQEAYGLSADDAVLQKTSLSFDVSVWELFWPLLSGARLVLARPGGQKDARYLQGLLEQQQITTLHFVPSMLQGFVQALGDSALAASVRRVICSGEELPAALAQQVRTRWPQVALHNLYGPTEAAVDVSAWSCQGELPERIPIGAPIANTQLYVLDRSGEPTPIGVAGEIHIGGVQVARGYLHRAALSAERFIPDPFSREPGARLYRTGDLGRWRADGTIEYLGRNDFQVKVRGYRIELGEIEARLRAYPGIADAVVLAYGEGAGERRLVAYYTVREAAAPEAMRAPLSSVLPESAPRKVDLEALRAHLSSVLPEYMVPAAYVRLDAFPLTANGKLDRRALPAPEEAAYARQQYEPPRGAVEETLARLWSEVLGVAQVGRADNFFDLGGHSLLAIRLIERMRQQQLYAEVRALFTAPTLAALAQTLRTSSAEVVVPENGIPAGGTHITPAMLPLVSLDAEQIAAIVRAVPGGAANVQDIYPLAPLQEGILFHHLMTPVGDPYVQQIVLGFAERACLERYLQALQQVIARHDILRTAVYWEGLPEPVQVVWREAPMQVQELSVQPGEDVLEQLRARFDPLTYRMEVRRAPLTRIFIAEDKACQRWVLLQLYHHLIDDITSLTLLFAEVNAFLLQQEHTLPAPLPFRNFIAQARLGVSAAEHERFFQRLLSGVQAPSAPYGLRVRPDEALPVSEYRAHLPEGLSRRVRLQARALKVSAASLFHLAWAQVLARLCNQADVVFGTVLFGRAGAGSGGARTLGVFINTLPIRIAIDARGAREGVLHTHELLADLLHHEHASLALAQRCSDVSATTPLINAALNYRHTISAQELLASNTREDWEGIELLDLQERTHYPLFVTVDDLNASFDVCVQAQPGIDPSRVCDSLQAMLEQLIEALEQHSSTSLHDLDGLPTQERRQLLVAWNDTARRYPRERCIHELFEAQAIANANATAVVHENRRVSYGELNERANRLAHHLRQWDVRPGDRVALCMDRCLELLVAEIAILKCGAAYVPLDQDAPAERQAFMLEDAAARIVLSVTGVEVPEDPAWMRIDIDQQLLADCSTENLLLPLVSDAPAYVMYTSGSTGKPKGVVVSHQSVGRLLFNNGYAEFRSADRMAFVANPAFDASTMEVWAPLVNGACLIVIPTPVLLDPQALLALLQSEAVTVLHLTAGLLSAYADQLSPVFKTLRYLLTGGDSVDPGAIERILLRSAPRRLIHCYGPTECTLFATTHEVRGVTPGARSIPIGRPISNTSIHVLNPRGQLAPTGVEGEIHIGGLGVAHGYLNRPELTAERFVPDPFAGGGARLYRSGDLGRWLADGTLEFLGRNDLQVKIRGYRIELGEIEACLRTYPGISDAIVLARGKGASEKRLVAYMRPTTSAPRTVELAALHAHLSKVLPEYMVPAAYMQLDAFPLTANGKVDRRALPEPDDASYMGASDEAPVGRVEEQLARIWAEVLGVERVNRGDNFFHLGGHSLLAIRLFALMRDRQLHAAMSDLFTAPTLRDMAAVVKPQSVAELEVPQGGDPKPRTQRILL